MKNIRFKNFQFLLLTVFFIGFVMSCEEDFTDIRTNIVNNNDFTTNDTTFNIKVSTKDISSVRADGIALGGVLGQYLLGVYNNENYKKIEASIITQLEIPFNLQFDNLPLGPDNDTITSIYTVDTAFLKLPYQATLIGNNSFGPIYDLDSIIGQTDEAFTLNVYRLASYLNELDPQNPTQRNSFRSDDTYDIFPEKLNVNEDYQLIPRNQDTAAFVLRRRLDNTIYGTDTVIVTDNAIPFLTIPIKKSIVQEVFLDRYEDTELSSQEAFNNYFRGLFIEAKGDRGSLISFNFNVGQSSSVPTAPNAISLRPSLQIYYTRTADINGNSVTRDTILPLSDSFDFGPIRTNQYIMTDGNAVQSHQEKIQGTAGSYVNLEILGDDVNSNGLPDQLDYLRAQNWLINDATVTLYVDKNTVGSDTIATPFRLFIFKDNLEDPINPNRSQVLDYLTEGADVVDGNLKLDSDRRPDRYEFNITDYISELVKGEIDYIPTLGVKVLSPTDLPTNSAIDTIIRDYNWNPKAVMLLNELEMNGNRRPTIKISYTKKIEEN